MDISVTGVDFPPTRQTRQLAKQQLDEALEEVAKYVDRVELFLVEFSAERSRTGTMCSAAIYLHGYSPMLVEEGAVSLRQAIDDCVTSVSRAVEERLRERRPGPSGLSILF